MSVRPCRCSTFSVHQVSSQPFPRSKLWFMVVELSDVMALPIVSLLCTEESLVSRLMFSRALCSAMNSLPIHRVLFPSTFQTQPAHLDHRVILWMEISFLVFCRTPFHSRVCNCIRNCSHKWNMFLQCRINSWKIHRACPLSAKGLFTRCFFSLKTQHLCFLKRLPPIRPSAELASTIDAVLPNALPSLPSS